MSLASFGTLQLEWNAVARETGEMKYRDWAERAIRYLYDRDPWTGLLPNDFHPETGEGRGVVSLGAEGDSYYEYLLKTWLQSGKSADLAYSRTLFENAAEAAARELVQVTSEDGRMYVADRVSETGELVHKMDHLACFAGGLFALARMQEEFADRAWYEDIAAGLTETCYQMYHANPSRLAAENYRFEGGRGAGQAPVEPDPGVDFQHSRDRTDGGAPAAWTSRTTRRRAAGADPRRRWWTEEGGGRQKRMVPGPEDGDRLSLQRPEALESMFYMWRLTKDKKYREWGWEIFEQGIERHYRVDGPEGQGYVGLEDATAPLELLYPHDRMESFFLAETLKYLYLLFSPGDVLPLDRWVFNTEAHPMMIANSGP